MALPTLTKTWNYDVNVGPNTGPSDSGATMTGWQTHWLAIKTALVTNLSPGWTVVGSGALGAGGGGGMDAVDRWVAVGDLRSTSTNTGSWIVLQNDAIKTGFQLLIQCQDGGGGWPDSSSWRVSPGGLYTGGDETNRPTATDEITLSDTQNWRGLTSGQANSYINAMMSSDGECTRILICFSNSTYAFYLFDKPKSPISGWTDPWVAVAAQYTANTGNIPRYTELCDLSTFTFAKAGSTTMKLYLTSEGWAGSTAGERMTWSNDLDGNTFPMAGIGLASETAGVRGRHGELFDIWWGSTIRAAGDHYPDTLPRQFVQAGDIILPWDPTAGGIVMV